MFNGSSCYGTSNATDLGGALLVPSPRWFLPVVVWRPRPGK